MTPALIMVGSARCSKSAERFAKGERIFVAVGTGGLGPLRRMRLSNVSTKVLKAAPGPILMYPREAI